MEKLNVAVIGAGIYGIHHVDVYHQNPYVNLIAVCDQSEKIRENIEKNYGLKTYNNVEDMLENEKIDAASIVTPDHLHVEPALACIEKGVDLLIEKPLATSVADCKKIYEAAKKNKVRVAVDFHKRWDPAAIFIYNKLKSSKGYPIRA
ncbi:MAG: Gfo/Idh/MocA family oxidoreductase, partial [Anaerococcus vaginalis]